jgi:hypothetical protein
MGGSMSTEEALIASQKEVIKLQNDKIKLINAITKTYVSGGICYSRSDECTEETTNLNKKFGLFATKNIGLSATCQTFVPVKGSICEYSPYRLSISVKISPDLE